MDKGKRAEVYCLFGKYFCHGILFICSHIIFAMLSPLCWLFSSFTDDKIISLYMIYLSLSCRNISFFKTYVIRYMTHLAARMLRRSWIRMYDKYKGDFFTFLENDNSLSLYCSLKKENNLLNDTSSEQAVVFWPLPLIPPKDYCIHSFWSQNTENKNDRPSQM